MSIKKLHQAERAIEDIFNIIRSRHDPDALFYQLLNLRKQVFELTDFGFLNPNLAKNKLATEYLGNELLPLWNRSPVVYQQIVGLVRNMWLVPSHAEIFFLWNRRY